MNQFSISLGKIFGIPVSVHWTFWILIVWIVVMGMISGSSGEELFWNVLLVLAAFICIGLHELGHALAARRFGISTKSITFLPIGGVAMLSRIPKNPKQELIISIAGPLVNVLIAFVLAMLLLFNGVMVFSTQTLESVTTINANNFLLILFSINITLFLFNLVPAFPMDGGRIFRALLAMVFSRLRATNMAVKIGQAFAVLFVLLGLLYNPFLIVIAIFILLGAQSELDFVKTSEALNQYQASDLMMRKFEIFKEDQVLTKAVTEILKGQDKVFVVKKEEVIKGFFFMNDILKGLSELGQEAKLKNITRTKLRWVQENQNAATVWELMKKEQLPVLFVGQPNHLIGIINSENIQEFIQLQTSNNNFLIKEKNSIPNALSLNA